MEMDDNSFLKLCSSFLIIRLWQVFLHLAKIKYLISLRGKGDRNVKINKQSELTKLFKELLEKRRLVESLLLVL